MTIRVAINHDTHYRFDRPVRLSPHVIRLRPAPHTRTPIRAYSLKVEPSGHFLNWQQDAFGNYLARLVFPKRARSLSVRVEVIADMTVINPFDFFLDGYAETFPFRYQPQEEHDLLPCLAREAGGALFEAFLAATPRHEQRTIDFLVAINQRVQEAIEYTIRMEPGVQKPEATLRLGRGSCRDSAWLLAQLLRHCGLAARFASGYLVQLKPDVEALDGPSGAVEDFTDLHAWCEVYLPGAGWVGLDPTSGLFAAEGHIPLACAPDPIAAAPITGATDECEVDFRFSNSVTRIHEAPRVTKPYTEEQFASILALGDAVDQRLRAGDVRLTMGGEPTFVSIDDMESAQWNTEALGADKLELAKRLLLRLRDRFAPTGLLHDGQGKWYPGEEIPRWALGLFWRKDGEALWREQDLLANYCDDLGHGIGDAERFARRLATHLAFDHGFCQPCFEDPLHYTLAEQSLPPNLELTLASAGTSLERQRLARVLEQGLDRPTGFVLPLAWNWATGRWASSRWETRRARLTLLPGDSPMGLRLPLDSLPRVEATERDEVIERDPFEARGPLASYEALRTAPFDGPPPPPPTAPQRERRTSREHWEVIRTALCVEPREGRLHVFMPPVTTLEHYVSLLARVEYTAAELGLPVVVEGYPPPRDHRIAKLLVTPDPGVIEVNIHPSATWRELVANTTALYEEARLARLGTEKFMVDGRHTGTGGGNHVTIGGATPADSPLLRRPDLLRSLVTFWQHHPSLSYLFSGTFIGPTSQAPRVDEGRDEMLYELEVAFRQVPSEQAPEPWLVDRLFRNLLIDITGNTHRAEFCIDKLFAPGSASGRLGLLELRGFEMPPHAHMALVQALLVRALVARFWEQPYTAPLVRWGTLLHDRFMLPHYVWADLEEVVADLGRHGIAFDVEWLRPFDAFRFPHYGEVQLDDLRLSLRWAIEPWHVLGEEIASFGTARYVDSSVERIQVLVDGLADSRYVLVCNGRRVPLRPTGRQGQAVAGVRYRAWQPPSALHPTIGVHTPLVFDLIDSWNGRSIGGCTYYVSHPGGRSYDDFPVNANAAESRRISRFWPMGHTPGPFTPRPLVDAHRSITPHGSRPIAMPPPDASDEYPHTLDLRRAAH